MIRTAVLLLATALAPPALAESHGVTVQNGTSETIRLIQIAPTPGGGDNRLRSTLPPGASGKIVYSTGCIATLRIGYDSGRTEDHANIDVCTDPRVVAGTDGVAGPPGQPGAAPVAKLPSAKSTTVASTLPAKAPPPVVPPWTGKSITKRFGGME